MSNGWTNVFCSGIGKIAFYVVSLPLLCFLVGKCHTETILLQILVAAVLIQPVILVFSRSSPPADNNSFSLSRSASGRRADSNEWSDFSRSDSESDAEKGMLRGSGEGMSKSAGRSGRSSREAGARQTHRQSNVQTDSDADSVNGLGRL
jgi:hypothetical protein